MDSIVNKIKDGSCIMYNIRLCNIIAGAGLDYAEYDNITGIEFGIHNEFAVYYGCKRLIIDVDAYTDMKVICDNERTEYDLNSKSWQQDLAFYLYNNNYSGDKNERQKQSQCNHCQH